MIDPNFAPLDFVVKGRMFIDRTFWCELDGNEEVPTKSEKSFYVPSVDVNPNWSDILKMQGVKPYFTFDPEVASLAMQVTAEQIEKARLEVNQHVVKSREDRTPVPPPDTYSAEQFLERERMMLFFSDKSVDKMSDFEKKLRIWSQDYGYIYDHRKSSGLLFPIPDEGVSKGKYEVEKEFMFHVSEFPEVILSVAEEINTHKARWGFRRTGNLDWPFDYDLVEKLPGVNSSLFTNLDGFVDSMNYLLQNLEYKIKK